MAEIDNLIAEVNKKYKTDIIRKASDLKGIEFIPYTSPMMNYLTRGGVPVGRIIELVGLPQSGKTTTALDIISNFQKKYTDKYCVYLDAENTIDKEWGETLGVDWSKVILIQPESEYGEELLDMLLDYIRSGKVGLAVLDSAPYKDTGVEELRYRCANGGDSRTCQYCRADNGKVFKRGEEPTLPRHPNCRCVYIPVVSDTFEDNELNELTGSVRGAENYEKWRVEQDEQLKQQKLLQEAEEKKLELEDANFELAYLAHSGGTDGTGKYSGIWIQDVTVEDYAVKKDKICC